MRFFSFVSPLAALLTVFILSPTLLAQTETTPPATGDTIAIQATWIHLPAGKIELVSQPNGQTTPCEAGKGIILDSTEVSRGNSLEVNVLKKSGKSVKAATLTVPAHGKRFILVLQGESAGATRAWLIPGDLQACPWGSAFFINQSSRTLRCSLDGLSCEIEPGAFKLNPFVASGENKTYHYLIEYKKDGKWITDCSTQTVLGTTRRFIFSIGPDDPSQSQLYKTSLADYRHDPLPPATEAKPLESQPAK